MLLLLSSLLLEHFIRLGLAKPTPLPSPNHILICILKQRSEATAQLSAVFTVLGCKLMQKFCFEFTPKM